eukprot:6205688-Prymnesium_polylepis.1
MEARVARAVAYDVRPLTARAALSFLAELEDGHYAATRPKGEANRRGGFYHDLTAALAEYLCDLSVQKA